MPTGYVEVIIGGHTVEHVQTKHGNRRLVQVIVPWQLVVAFWIVTK